MPKPVPWVAMVVDPSQGSDHGHSWSGACSQVEALYQAWCKKGKPTNKEECRQEITIQVLSERSFGSRSKWFVSRGKQGGTFLSVFSSFQVRGAGSLDGAGTLLQVIEIHLSLQRPSGQGLMCLLSHATEGAPSMKTVGARRERCQCAGSRIAIAVRVSSTSHSQHGKPITSQHSCAYQKRSGMQRSAFGRIQSIGGGNAGLAISRSFLSDRRELSHPGDPDWDAGRLLRRVWQPWDVSKCSQIYLLFSSFQNQKCFPQRRDNAMAQTETH